MVDSYYQIEPDNFADFGIVEEPDLPEDVSFTDGVLINTHIDDTLVFEVDFPNQDLVPHLMWESIPVFSGYLLEVLKRAGVDNLQVFPAKLRNQVQGLIWDDYYATNVIGLVSAAHLEESEYETLMHGDSEGVEIPLLAFTDLVLDSNKLQENLLMFRLAESPDTLLLNKKTGEFVKKNSKGDGWGFDAIRIRVE